MSVSSSPPGANTPLAVSIYGKDHTLRMHAQRLADGSWDFTPESKDGGASPRGYKGPYWGKPTKRASAKAAKLLAPVVSGWAAQNEEALLTAQKRMLAEKVLGLEASAGQYRQSEQEALDAVAEARSKVAEREAEAKQALQEFLALSKGRDE